MYTANKQVAHSQQHKHCAMHTVNKEVAYTANSTHWTMHTVNKEMAYPANSTNTGQCIQLIKKWHTLPTTHTLGHAYS